MPIRPYQEEMLQATVEERNAGCWAQLAVLPTGTGKTVVAANLLRHHPLKRGEQLCFLVHRTELVNQTVRKFRQYNPLLKVQPHTGEHEADRDCDVVVASVQTIGRMTEHGHTKRLTKFNPDRFRIVVCDEVHRATSAGHRNVLRYFRVLKGEPDVDTSKLLLGITATSQRSDGVGLEVLFQKIVFERSIRRMIGEGWLSRIHGKMVQTEADITGVKSRKDDFVPDQLSEALNTPERNDLIVRRYLELGEDMPAIAFTIDVAHSHDLAERFHAHGVTAFPVSGSTPESDRQAIFRAFDQGRCRVLISCEVLVEGFDRPIASVALMARPTKSQLWYIQALGRVLRPYPAPEDKETHSGWRKPHALVLDFSDTCGRHSLNTVPSLFGLRHEFDMGGKDVLDTVEEVERLQAGQPTLDLKACRDILEVRSSVRDIDLLKDAVVPPIVRQHSRLEWREDGAGSYRLILPDKGTLLIVQNALGYREIYKSKNGVQMKHATCRTLADALKCADALVPTKLLNQMGTDAQWLTKKPTEKQIQFLWQLDKDLRKKWPTVGNKPGWHVLYEYAVEQYGMGRMAWSRPAIGSRIGRHCGTRDLKQAGFKVETGS